MSRAVLTKSEKYRESIRRNSGRMRRILALLAMLGMLGSGGIALGEEARPMGILDSVLEHFWIRSFLERRGILTEDRELYDCANAFLTAALEGDLAAMKALVAPNAVNEIGEAALDEMLSAFVAYFQADSFALEEPCGPNTSESIDHGKRSKELKGCEIATAGTREYRLALRCISRDDWDAGNVGLWSLSIIDAARDTDNNPDHPYRGDLQYRTGIFFDVPRLR